MNHLPARPRNLLFAPAVRPDLVAKTPTSSPDLVAIDLEDATPVAAKGRARDALADLVDSVRGRSPVTVRVNATDSPWFAADVEEGEGAVVPIVFAVQAVALGILKSV